MTGYFRVILKKGLKKMINLLLEAVELLKLCYIRIKYALTESDGVFYIGG